MVLLKSYLISKINNLLLTAIILCPFTMFAPDPIQEYENKVFESEHLPWLETVLLKPLETTLESFKNEITIIENENFNFLLLDLQKVIWLIRENRFTIAYPAENTLDLLAMLCKKPYFPIWATRDICFLASKPICICNPNTSIKDLFYNIFRSENTLIDIRNFKKAIMEIFGNIIPDNTQLQDWIPLIIENTLKTMDFYISDSTTFIKQADILALSTTFLINLEACLSRLESVLTKIKYGQSTGLTIHKLFDKCPSCGYRKFDFSKEASCLVWQDKKIFSKDLRDLIEGKCISCNESIYFIAKGTRSFPSLSTGSYGNTGNTTTSEYMLTSCCKQFVHLTCLNQILANQRTTSHAVYQCPFCLKLDQTNQTSSQFWRKTADVTDQLYEPYPNIDELEQYRSFLLKRSNRKNSLCRQRTMEIC